MDEPKVLWVNDLARRYGKDRVTIWRWCEAKKLPPIEVKIGTHTGWYESTILAFERRSAVVAAA